MEYRRPLKAGVGVEARLRALRRIGCRRSTEDRSLSADIARVAAAIRDGEFDSGCEES